MARKEKRHGNKKTCTANTAQNTSRTLPSNENHTEGFEVAETTPLLDANATRTVFNTVSLGLMTTSMAAHR